MTGWNSPPGDGGMNGWSSTWQAPGLVPFQPYPPAPLIFPPRQSAHRVNLFLFFGALWLAKKALLNHQRALDAERNLLLMQTNPNEPGSGPVPATQRATAYFAPRSAPATSDPLRAGIITPDVDDGMYLVGTDIPAGTYRCNGIPGDSVYWERLRDASGEARSIIANFCGPGQGYVTVQPGEFFRSRNSGGWTHLIGTKDPA